MTLTKTIEIRAPIWAGLLRNFERNSWQRVAKEMAIPVTSIPSGLHLNQAEPMFPPVSTSAARSLYRRLELGHTTDR